MWSKSHDLNPIKYFYEFEFIILDFSNIVYVMGFTQCIRFIMITKIKKTHKKDSFRVLINIIGLTFVKRASS